MGGLTETKIMTTLLGPMAVIAKRRTPGPTGPTDYSPYLLDEDFENPGFENSWYNLSNLVDPDYTTSPAPLEGSYSARVNYTGSTILAMQEWTTAENAVTACFMFHATTLPSAGTSFIYLADAGQATIASLLVGSGIMTALHGVTTGNGSASFTTGVTYYIWVEYTRSTASNGVLKVYLSTTTTRPALPDISIATGSSTAAAKIVMLYQVSSCDFVIDHIRVKAGAANTMPNWPT